MANSSTQAEVLNRLKNVKGHLAGIERMVEEGQECSNVLIQLSATRAAIEKIGIYILENNAIECLGDVTDNKDDKHKVEQIVKQMISFLK
ncbi:metal-sensitive transcriptional regulator [Sporomusa sp.]|uniref:metal-sensitive transcriptional regulator n=1 Tax=Sporomusa sp. TaxID=2078658 RepID=UPI002CFA29A1|nr:metal-sensitive transcriptional regulator [Sporomusa sp.]HWR41527.1 metal-sensitive transcriptional regulator [Sporomusa sp.]